MKTYVIVLAFAMVVGVSVGCKDTANHYRTVIDGPDCECPTLTECPDGWTAMCHKPGTIAVQNFCVKDEAVEGHLQHGDTLGFCGSSDDDCEPPTFVGGDFTTRRDEVFND